MTMQRLYLACLLALVFAHPAGAQRAASVKVDSVREEPLTQTIPIIGRFVARERGVVAAAVAGPVKTMHAQVGDRVAAGTMLAELDGAMRQSVLAQRDAEKQMHQARLEAARAQLEITKDEMQRLEKLKGSTAFPRKQFEDQRHEVVRFTSALREADSAVRRINAQHRAAAIELSRTKIIAPYGGVVTARHVSAGAYLRQGDPVITLVNDTDLEIEAEVPGVRAAQLQAGITMSATLEDGTELSSRVRTVIPDEDPATRTRQVRLVPGTVTTMPVAVNQSVTLLVPVGPGRVVLSVHKDAVISRRGKQMVYVVKEGKATIRPVTLGEAVGARLEVLGGLAKGDLVVVRGNERLRPGQDVKFKKS
jgi:RND family efflux transporter MFP subunit